MHDPMANPEKITLDYNPLTEMYEIETSHPTANCVLHFGRQPRAVILFMQANCVRHFDYGTGIMNASDAMESFLYAADEEGYEV